MDSNINPSGTTRDLGENTNRWRALYATTAVATTGNITNITATNITGTTVTGTNSLFTNATAVNITGTTITGGTIKMSGDTVATQTFAEDSAIVFAIALG